MVGARPTASRAERTESPVPSGSRCTATRTLPSISPADSGAATTTSGSTPSGRTDSTTQSTSRRPSSGCRCFGVADFMRVPWPAAITIAASPSFKAGAPGFEPGIAGPKPAALPLGYAPELCAANVEEEVCQGDDRKRDHKNDRKDLHDERSEER